MSKERAGHEMFILASADPRGMAIYLTGNKAMSFR